MKIREVSPGEAPSLKISKIQKIPLFLDVASLEELFSLLLQQAPLLALYASQKVSPTQGGICSCDEFIEAYKGYIEKINAGKTPLFPELFSYALSETPDIFVSIRASEEKRVLRPLQPPLQLQPHTFYYSEESQSFYSMTFGEKSISLGFQLSYPLLYQDPQSGEAMELQKNPSFPNLRLFQLIRSWVREKTLPLAFLVEGKKKVLPIRIGKKSLPLLSNHIQLTNVPFELVRENSKTLL